MRGEKIMELNEEVKLERVMRLSKAAGVGIEDAKNALEASNYDMLDAMVYLEQLGKVTAPNVNDFTTEYKKEKSGSKVADADYMNVKTVSFREVMGNIFRGIGKIIKVGNENFLDLTKDNREVIRIPLTIVVILLIISFWFFLPLAIVLLFFGIRYSFSGKAFKNDDVFNTTMRKASDVADNIKREFSDEVKSETEKKDEN